MNLQTPFLENGAAAGIDIQNLYANQQNGNLDMNQLQQLQEQKNEMEQQ